MSWQTIELNMIPDTKEWPIVYASQFDSDRTISFQMFTGKDEWTIPEGLTIELHCRKVDDNIVTLEPASVDGSVITFVTTEQLTACSGDNKCELSFIDENDLVIGSLNFILKVEADPISGGLTSETAIYDLTQQIEDIATEVIGEDYYDKTEVDALLADKADVSDLPDMTQYYTKTQTDTLLNGKADASTTYTKTQTDTLLNGKADASTTYTKTEVDNALALKANSSDLATVATTGNYDDLINKPVIPAAQIQSDYAQADNTQVDYIKNKPDIAGMIAAAIFDILPIGQASGDIASFDTAISAPLVSLSNTIVAKGGGGTPATPIPIVGHSELNLVRCGKNILEVTSSSGTSQGITATVNSDGSITVNGTATGTYIYTINNTLVLDGNYILSGCPAGGSAGTYRMDCYWSGQGALIDSGNGVAISPNGNAVTTRIVIMQGVTVNNLVFYPMVRLATETDAIFAPYNGQTFKVSFGQTVYGGVYDANRGKVKPNVYYPSYNGETITGRWLSSKDVYVEGNTPTTGAQVVCLDEYDTEIDVSELSVDTIVGTNNVFSDCGVTTARYKDSIQHYIDMRI